MSLHPILSPLPKLILFDADGTLYDSERLSYEASRLAAYDLHGFDLTWELFDAEIIRGSRNTPELLQVQGLIVNPEQVQASKREHFARLVAEELRPMPGLVDFLSWCEQQSIDRVIVSANRRSALDASLATLGIAEFFQGIVSFEDIANRRKPDPHAYQLGLRSRGIAVDQALAVEDTAKGIASAHAAGLRCIGICNDTNKLQDLVEAELIIHDYRDLLELTD